jgi:hypothetical protein
VPLLLQDVDPTITPEPLGKLNWIMFRAKDDFDAGIKALNYALELDLDWVKAHTRLLVRAREWDAKGRNHSYLLIDADLEEAQGWLSQAGNKKPSVTQLQVAYVAASQQGMIDRQQKQLRGFYLVSIIYGVLQWTVSYLVVFNEITETGLVFLSPIWLLGLVFGISGLTVGRTSLKRALILTVASAILLYLFFIVIWPLL